MEKHKPFKHLSVRAAWHDNQWNGTICRSPSQNTYCLALPRIYEGKEEWEDSKNIPGCHWSELKDRRPPCQAESGAFMSEQEWSRTFVHPYKDIKKANHSHLLPTIVKIPSYSTFSVPFWWMLRNNQRTIQDSIPIQLPRDQKPPFASAWVYDPKRQEAILNLFFNRIQPESSLVFFYCKNGNAVNENISRLIIGIGFVLKVSDIQQYNAKGGEPYPMWDRLFSHSVRLTGKEKVINGILFPYHDYLETTGDPDEDKKRSELLNDIAVQVEENYIRQFSYGTEHVEHDAALSVLVKAMESVRSIRDHGIVSGAWNKCENWLNAQMARVWEARGAFPGLGSALEAFGVPHGTALSYDLAATGMLGENEDPWPLVEKLMDGSISPPSSAYAGNLDAIRTTWKSLPKTRRNLLHLISRFSLTPKQAQRWYQPENRAKFGINVQDGEILANPYIITELDDTDGMEPAISVSSIDLGLLPEDTIAANHPIPTPSCIESHLDKRRIRAAICQVLKTAMYQNGDTLLSEPETISALEKLPLSKPCIVGSDWLAANVDYLSERLRRFELPNGAALQLMIMGQIEDRIEKILIARAIKPLPEIKIDWKDILIRVIEKNSDDKFDEKNVRYLEALNDQVAALKKLTTRKLTALIGPAGTGKTSVMGALLGCAEIKKNGVLLLAPTGKARVRLSRMADKEAFTIAQFLTHQKRYDWKRMRPLFEGQAKYRAEKTVVIDECSMVTIEDLYAVLQALDLNHVTRIILVGDPNQLPPIGPGRPFADLCAYLDPSLDESDTKRKKASGALAKLRVTVRQVAEGISDALQLANWYSGEEVDPNADQIFEKLSDPKDLKDLDIILWKTPEELQDQLTKAFVNELGLSSPDDIAGFNQALGFVPYNDGWSYPFDDPDGAENFQILSPVKAPAWGTLKLNRFIQETYRPNSLRDAWGMSLGGQQIVKHDKVIQNTNEWRNGYNGNLRESDDYQIANGEIGVAAYSKKGFMNIVFAGRPMLTFGYQKRDFREGEGPLDLAYAITVHKAQGSEFEIVFVIIPEQCRILSRELLYTSLTRAKKKLILLIQGESPAWLFNLSDPKLSVTANRNGNLFFPSMRLGPVDVPYADHLIHRTEKEDLFVRSKSEVIIANMLYREEIPFEYERLFVGEVEPGLRRPDFTFIDAGGELILWEHLGMLYRDTYRLSWEKKKQFYETNEFFEGVNLFTTSDDERGAIDSKEIMNVIKQIKELI